MPDDTRPDHVQIDMDQAATQVVIGFDCGSVVAVLPECAFAILVMVVFLAGKNAPLSFWMTAI